MADMYLTASHLREVVKDALEQCLSGKGKERHGEEDNLEHQPIWAIAGNVGLGFPIGQALKKLMELRAHEGYSWRREALGVIVYTAFAIMLHDYQENQHEETKLSDPE